jgi:guanosine-3',5'-bis(diphosphate) 3'-pyrophosphohydrolase
MEFTTEQLAEERAEILRRYRKLMKAAGYNQVQVADKKRIRKAFDLAVEAHKEMRRKSGEPYIYHPIAVAQIAAEEMGLGATSIICALLHDTVEDTDLTLEDMERLFGKKVAKIIDGLTKIEGVFDQSVSLQAENFRKIVLTLAQDIRVILIKIADRLHNMRTLTHMRRDKQLKIASETLFLYAPLAHRLGLYNIKTELEDLALKYTEPETYEEIEAKLEKTKAVRDRFVSRFVLPIRKALDEHDIQYEIKGRTKSLFSIWNKTKVKGVPFEEIYDIFAIRIILKVPPTQEKAEIWKTYSLVTDIYQPKPDRLRDWISFPRANGYESLHVTVMSPTGKWVEVQIRSERMDEIAEKGYAAHWKYKEKSAETAVDEWLGKVREMLDNHKEGAAIELIDDFKLNLYSDEIYVFTPKGELRSLPAGSGILDFAYEIHSELGDKCLGGKVNNKLVPLSYVLKNGDQIEIITAQKQSPKEDWLNFVVSGKARSRIKTALKEEKRQVAEEGKAIFERKIKRLKINFDHDDVQKIISFFHSPDLIDFYFKVGKGQISSQQIRDFYKEEGKKSWYSYLTQKLGKKNLVRQAEEGSHADKLIKQYKREENQLLIGENDDRIAYTLSPCCNPIPGDEVFGFVTVSDGINIHKTNCPNAVSLLSNYAYRVIKARWTKTEDLAFLVGLRVTGFDDVGIVNKITRTISNQMKVNMRSLSFDGNDGIFEGKIMLYVQDTRHLNELMDKLKQVAGVIQVERMNADKHHG